MTGKGTRWILTFSLMARLSFAAQASDSPSIVGSSGQPTEIPFDWDRRQIVVKGSAGKLEGLKYMIDTASSSTVISLRMARKLKLKRYEVGKRTPGGNRIQVEQVTIPRLMIGQRRFDNVPAQVRSESTFFKRRGIDALIGLNLLKRGVLSIDYETRKIVFGQFDDGSSSIRFDATLPFVLVPLQVGDHILRVLLDTGATDLILFRDRVKGRISMKQLGCDSILRGIGGDRRVCRVLLSDVRMDSTRWNRLTGYLLETKPGQWGNIDGLLGLADLKLKRLSFDFKNGKVSWQVGA